METYIDNYGSEVAADYCADLPFCNNREDSRSEEIWRRLHQVYTALESCKAKHLLRELLNDMERWMEKNSIESPNRWE